MTRKPEISQQQFEKLLNWLSSDRELAGLKYESIRLRLIKFFTLRGFQTADELADVTIDTVAGKIDLIIAEYDGDPTLYFHGVAKYIYLKYKKIPPPEVPPYFTEEVEIEDESLSEKYACLEKCLQKLKKTDRNLITGYFQESKAEKIKLRKNLAKKKKISNEILRVRVHRIKDILEKCVRQCYENKG